jgi:uncharacterized YigZ family protein
MIAEEFPIPAGTHRVETVIERSRFITTVAHAPDADAARAFIGAMREEFADATHNCWAYVAGPPGDTAAVGMSDAGEPHGTAGRPMLDVLVHSGVGEIVAVVTRYYGGTKLGTGGLVKAYGGGVQQALATLQTVRRIVRTSITVTVGYADVDVLRRSVSDVEGSVASEEYGEAVRYCVLLPARELARFTGLITDRTAGRARFEAPDA